MGLLRALFVAGLVVSGFAEQGRILRRSRTRRNDFDPNMDMSLCQSHTNHYLIMVGEKTVDGMDYIIHNPDLTQHREIMGYTNEDIANLWEDAINYAWEYIGIDFRNEEYDSDKGMMEIDGYVMMPVTVNVGLRITYTSSLGHLDCPMWMGDEAIVVIPTKNGEYTGTFGAQFGGTAPSFPGELGMAYGSYTIDLDLDGDYEQIKYHTNSPMRNVLGTTRVDCIMESELYGIGRNDGRMDFDTMGSDGTPHASVRTLGTFPAAWDFDVQVKTPANNYGEQFPFTGENPNDRIPSP